MSRTLVILRHAKSDWPPSVADFDRPLSARGRRDAPVAGRWLAEHVVAHREWDQVLVSPARRTQQTWAAVAAELPTAPTSAEVVVSEPCIYAASWTTLLSVVQSTDAAVSTLLVVGHNPGCEDLVTRLADPTRGSAQAWERMSQKYPTAGLAVLQIVSDWRHVAPGEAVLQDFVVARG